MISRSNRFHGLNSLRPVYKFGKNVRRQHISLRYSLNAKRRSYRLAVVVSKKVEKSAVKRNRMRRRLFEAVRQLSPQIDKPYDLVLTVFSVAVADMPASDLQKQVAELLQSAGVLDVKT